MKRNIMLMLKQINLKISANGKTMVENKNITKVIKSKNYKTKQKW